MSVSTKDYCDGIEYQQDTIEAIYLGDGRLFFEDSIPRYEYNLTDHLGNTRLSFTDKNGDGQIDIFANPDSNEVLTEEHYYPFGLTLNGKWMTGGAEETKYLYNGKELNEDFGLNWIDYGAREYDPSIGRFGAIDRFAEKYYPLTPYQYAANNPIKFIDVNGDSIFVNNTGGIIRNDQTDNLVFIQDKDGNLTPIGELGGEIDAQEIYSNLLAENIKKAKKMLNPLAFKKKVRNKGEWDLKNDKISIFGLANDGETTFIFEGESMESQDLGNHHFGVVAKAYGWFPSEKFILKEAGRAQMAAGTSKPEWQKYEYKINARGTRSDRVMLPPYGDDPRDQKWIKSGFQYYKNYKKKKTDHDIMKSVKIFLYIILVVFINACNSQSSIFNEKPELIQKINIENDLIPSLLIYKSFSNATVNESIQIRVRKENNEEEVLQIYERYDQLISSKVDENELCLVMADTSGYKDKIETVKIKISELVDLALK